MQKFLSNCLILLGLILLFTGIQANTSNGIEAKQYDTQNQIDAFEQAIQNNQIISSEGSRNNRYYQDSDDNFANRIGKTTSELTEDIFAIGVDLFSQFVNNINDNTIKSN